MELQKLAEYFSFNRYTMTNEDWISSTFSEYQRWKKIHLMFYPEDEDLTPTEMVDLYYKELHDDTMAP